MSEKMSGAPKFSGNPRPFVVLGYLLIVSTFGLLGTWAAYAKLDSAVIAGGAVAVESNRKAVQHFEGGIVDEILVKESEIVNKGDVLIRLRSTQATASAETLASQLDGAMALESRLMAESERAAAIVFPDRLLERASLPTTRKILQDQQNQFAERRKALEGEAAILRAQIEQLKGQILGLEAVVASSVQQQDNLKGEYLKVRDLADKGLYPTNRLRAMERDLLQIEGRLGQSRADIARSQQAIGETELQIVQTEKKFQEDVLQQLREVRVQIAEYSERFRVAEDILKRVEIVAPQSGMVQNLKVHTVGGVIGQGEVIMEIVPLNEPLNVQARVSPIDINYVLPQLDAEVRFPGFRSRTAPSILGRVRTVSADSLFDEVARQPYYLAIIEVPDSAIPQELRGKLTPGMPADIMIATGERTVLDYLTAPLMDAVRKSLREK
ncbi:MAG: HlyD family type I secretion periplasmic adaptor subunit [Hyphomicrobiaceae bacterium]